MPKGTPVKRRRRSLGSVYYHKPSKRWTYKYTVGDKRKQGYEDTRAAAEQALARATVMVADGGITSEDPKFSDWGVVWLKSRDVADKTRESYKWMLSHMFPQLGSKRLSKLTPVNIEAAYSELLKNGLSPTSVGSVHRAFGNCIRSAYKKGLIGRDVVSLCDAPRSTKRKPHVLSRVEWGKLVHASRDEPTGLLVEFLLKTGMRVDVEALSLHWSQLDLDAGFAKVSESKTAAGEGRNIPLDIELKDRLRSLRREHQELKLATGGNWNPHDYVFVNANGNRQSLTNLRTRMYRRVKTAADVPMTLTFHDLRHNCGSYLLSEHVPITMVSKILGHANVAITLAIYAYALEEDTELVRQAMARVGEA
jgi:integrase